ncbi:Prospero homeobox protein 1 [Varanus komodoensis]|nr:Prospero homeobox protein 1 [Varanus komodoensis]
MPFSKDTHCLGPNSTLCSLQAAPTDFSSSWSHVGLMAKSGEQIVSVSSVRRLLQVPERFLEVAQITLREFFNAIIAGKDVDPSWKKAIYKVICKLDSEVPEIFKSPNCLQELLHE